MLAAVSPPLPIDSLWHLHILDTEAYAKDCGKIFEGCFWDHHARPFIQHSFNDSAETAGGPGDSSDEDPVSPAPKRRRLLSDHEFNEKRAIRIHTTRVCYKAIYNTKPPNDLWDFGAPSVDDAHFSAGRLPVQCKDPAILTPTLADYNIKKESTLVLALQ